jgi:hypothetical protein
MKSWLVAALIAVSSSSAIAAPPPVPVMAQPAAPATQLSEAEALAFVRVYSPSHLRRKAELLILEKNFLPGLRQSADMAAVLDAFPQLGPELQKAMVAQVDIYIAEYDERYFPRAAAIVREALSGDDVRALTAFYGSPTGQKMLSIATENVDGTEIMELAAKDQAVDSAVATRQAMRAGILTYGKLSAAERAEINAIVASPPGRKFSAIMPKLVALQTELMNDPGPRFKASSEKAMADAFKRVTAIDSGASD